MTDTTFDRYIGLADRAVHDNAALEELLALFASHATVRIGPEPVRGQEAIAAFYRAHFATFADSRHYWNTTVLDDGTLRAEWAAGWGFVYFPGPLERRDPRRPEWHTQIR